jgi:hypothetical protein
MMGRMKDLGRLFLRNAQKTGESAAEMIEQRAQIQRLAGQVRKLDRERETLIRAIGAKVYGLHGQGKVRNQDVLGDCQRIDAIIGEIGKVRHEIEQIRLASLEQGVEIPVLEDEAPLDVEEATPAPTPAEPIEVELEPEPPAAPVADAPVAADESAAGEADEAAPEPKPEE